MRLIKFLGKWLKNCIATLKKIVCAVTRDYITYSLLLTQMMRELRK